MFSPSPSFGSAAGDCKSSPTIFVLGLLGDVFFREDARGVDSPEVGCQERRPLASRMTSPVFKLPENSNNSHRPKVKLILSSVKARDRNFLPSSELNKTYALIKNIEPMSILCFYHSSFVVESCTRHQ